jgi:hypothetical protein
MYVSPPITILALLAVAIAGAAWLKPPHREAAQVPVSASNATYSQFVLWTKDLAIAERQYLTAEQFIEALANKLGKDNEALATHTGKSL